MGYLNWRIDDVTKNTNKLIAPKLFILTNLMLFIKKPIRY